MTSTIYDQSGTLSCFGEDVGGMEHVPPEQFCFAFERDPTPTVASVREVEPQPQPEREGSILAGGLSLPTHFGEVLARLEGSPSRERRHVEMKSAVRGLQRALRRPLQEIPTDPAALRKMLKAVVPASTGLTKERWSRIRSLASAAMRGMGCDLQPGRDVLGHSPEWKALAANLQTKAQKLGLSRFMSFCTRSAIRPSEVTEATFRDFRAALETRSLQKAPDAVYRSSVRIWNKAVEEVAGWPSVVLKLERHAHFYSFDWHEFPASFAVDVEEFLDRSACEDEFDPHYVPACRPGTIELRRRQLRQLASLLVHSGFPIEGVKSLTVLAK